MKAFSLSPVVSALALALGVSIAHAQSSPPQPAATPASSASPSAGSDASESDRTGGRYGPGYGRGPGMMGGWGQGMMRGPGPGYGMGGRGGYGPGWGMGPGMMHGWGMGPGMMYGPGAGMGMGPWMGMGPGMMGAYGPHRGWGPMGQGRALDSLDLEDSQRKQLRELHQQQRRRHWELMGQMHEELDKLHESWGDDSGTRDRAAILAAHKRLADLRQQMLESRLDAADQLDKILTPEQREQLRAYWGGTARGRLGR